MKITKQLHTTGRDATDQQNVCGNCFTWVEHGDVYCWSCGVEFDDGEEAYNIEDLEISPEA